MNTAIIKARSVARRLGLKQMYYRFFPQRSYEEKFNQEISAELQAGDLVWDIGANLGFYTKMFGQSTGSTGRVFAFEPVPWTYEQLCIATREYPWVQNEQIALSDFDGVSRMLVGKADTVGRLATSNEETTSGVSVDVHVMCGDSYWKKSGVTPNLLKIDVEGFEEEVLKGMELLLAAPQVRAIFLEVHFEILESRGRSEAPLRIEKLLRSNGLMPRWVDSSHIVAKRKPGETASTLH
jgi:FkbM family methyltransferase